MKAKSKLLLRVCLIVYNVFNACIQVAFAASLSVQFNEIVPKLILSAAVAAKFPFVSVGTRLAVAVILWAAPSLATLPNFAQIETNILR